MIKQLIFEANQPIYDQKYSVVTVVQPINDEIIFINAKTNKEIKYKHKEIMWSGEKYKKILYEFKEKHNNKGFYIVKK